MRQFEIIVAPPSIQNKAAKLRFIAIEAGLLLVGKSQALITEYCARHKVTEEGKEIFASGTWENGQLVFEDSTPGWKRDELREFLAGQAVWLSVFNRDMDILRNNIARIPPDPILDFPSVFRPL